MMNLQNIFNATSPGFALNSFGFYPFDTASSEKQNGGDEEEAAERTGRTVRDVPFEMRIGL